MTTLDRQRWREDAARFLKLLLSECGGGPNDHDWRRCRRCLAFDQLQGHQPLARKLVNVALETLEDSVRKVVSKPVVGEQ